jgi:CYTH domain-containing protein
MNERNEKEERSGNIAPEIERKFLVAMPPKEFLHAAGVTKWEITQTYLLQEGGEGSRRVRRAVSDAGTLYTYTAKRRQTAMTCLEEERPLTREEYEALLASSRPDSAPVVKTRYRVPYEGHTLEIDVYPFWGEVAVLEVELQSEDEAFLLPPQLHVLREVTGEGRYKNTSIARWLFDHPDTPLPI